MNQGLLERVLSSSRLPTLPTIAIEVIDLVQQQDVNIKQIAHTISHDPALTTKILKTVNSSFYGQSQPIGTISHALVILGLNAVKTLALGFTLVGNLKESSANGFDHMAFWRRSLYAAATARTIAREVGLVQQEEAFLGGLLQDLGMLALVQTLEEPYRAVITAHGERHEGLCARERAAFDTDHAEIGGVLAERWKLPPVLWAPIRFHEQPGEAPPALADVVRCVAIGKCVADVFMEVCPGQALEAYYQRCKEWFDLSRERAEPILAKAHCHTAEIRRLFDLPTGPLENAGEVLARANEALLQINLLQDRKSSELEERARQLAVQATTDSLTGVANRGRFNEFIRDEFAKVAGSRSPLSVVFLDADHFKKFNDTYGHQCGDRVLVELAAAVKRAMPETALVSRYGGEEFAVVIPAADRVTAAGLAEATRRIIESVRIESEEGQMLSITASIGVASHDGTFFDSPEQLLKAADQGVYAAKAAGRNCVRVFAPRPKVAPAA